MYRIQLVFATTVVAVLIGTLRADEPKPPPKRVPQQQAIQIQIRFGRIPPVEDNPQRPSSSGLIVADRILLNALAAAKKLIEQQQYDRAIPVLQSLLDSPEDAATPTDRTKKSVLRSLRLEVRRLIGSMPAAGRAAYERHCGPDARRLLTKAIEEGDRDLLAETARRFFHTQAGYDATHRLGSSYLDHNQPLAAALCFQRLCEIPAVANKWGDMLSLKTAVCWVRAGMPEQAVGILDQLQQTSSRGTIRLAGRDVQLFRDKSQALNWLVELFDLQPPETSFGVNQWAMLRGNASRTGAGFGSGPGGKAAWTTSTSFWNVPFEQAPFSNGRVDVARQIRGIQNDFSKQGVPAIPSVTPLIVDNVVLMRTVDKLKAIDLTSGKELRWEANAETERYELEAIRYWLERPDSGDRGSILDPLLKQRVFTDATFGSLSSDGKSVFVLDRLGFLAARGAPTQFFARNVAVSQHPLAPKTFNRLNAYDIRSGKLRWRIAGQQGDSKTNLADRYFLGPPLPLGHSLYCLAEAGGEIRLLVLDPRSGKLQWSQSLESAPMSITEDPHRRQSGLSPSYAGGVLVCPTGSGSAVAIDLAMRSLMWRYQYRNYENYNPRDRRRLMIIAMRARAGNAAAQKKPEGRWLDSVATIAGGRAILTPRDSDEMHCVNLLNGTLLWKKPREQRLYVGGVYDNRLIVVGSGQVELLRLDDGTTEWTHPIPMPSGRGLQTGNQFHIPLSTAAIATIDLENGRRVSLVKLKDGTVAGNLISSNGMIVSQGVDSLIGFKQLTTSRQRASRDPVPAGQDQ